MNLGPRFWSKVDQSAGPEGCWLWTAALSHGYGAFGFGKSRVEFAHRLAYEDRYGVLPSGLDHRCRVTQCVNPLHLRPADQSQNNENQAARGRRSKSGVRNVHKHPDGWEVRVKKNGVKHYGGLFRTVEEAEPVAVALRLRLFTYNTEDIGVPA